MDHLSPLTSDQYQLALPLVSEIAQLGTSLTHLWPHHPSAPYFTRILTLRSARRTAAIEDEYVDTGALYTRLFNARPKGYRLTADYGAVARIEGEMQLIAQTISSIGKQPEIHPLPGALRSLHKSEATPIVSLEKTRAMLFSGYHPVEAALAAIQLLSAKNMAPLSHSQHLLPIVFHPPRRRKDGDWLIGALKRLHEALADTVDLTRDASKNLSLIDKKLPKMREDAKAKEIVNAAAAMPAITLKDAQAITSTSQKSTLATLAFLEEHHILMEFKGSERYRAWTLHESIATFGHLVAA